MTHTFNLFLFILRYFFIIYFYKSSSSIRQKQIFELYLLIMF